MDKLSRYKGILPAFYACYDDEGHVSPERVRILTRYLLASGVKGTYVCGSSGECIYQNKEERKQILENVIAEAKGQMTIIAHVACNNTEDSMELAAHAEKCGVDAIAAIPPIYFHLPDAAIANYWNDISMAAPNTDFIIYNIPQLAGVALSVSLFRTMLNNSRVIGVKNSSMPTQDIQMFKDAGGEDCIVFNGPDEQFIAGRMIGADGAIGGTFGVMPALYLKADEYFLNGNIILARAIQNDINRIINALCSSKASMYAVIKAVLKLNGINLGSVRKPFLAVTEDDMSIVQKCDEMIQAALKKYNCL